MQTSSLIITLEGSCFVHEEQSHDLDQIQLDSLNEKRDHEWPVGVFYIVAVSSSADNDDFDEDDEGGEQKVFVSVTLCVSSKLARHAEDDPLGAGLLPLLDTLAHALNGDFEVSREDWRCTSCETSEEYALDKRQLESSPATRTGESAQSEIRLEDRIKTQLLVKKIRR